MKSVESWIRSVTQEPFSQEKDLLVMGKLRENSEKGVEDAAALLTPYTIPFFRKRYLKYMKLEGKEDFSSFFHARNYEIILSILKRMVREIKKAEAQKKEGREWLYKRIHHPYTQSDLASDEMDITSSEFKIPFAKGIHGWYYTYYVRNNEETPLQAFPRFINLYKQEIKAKLRQIKRDYYEYQGKECVPGRSGHKESLSKRTGKYKIDRITYYSILTAAKKCGVRPKTLYNWVNAGDIPFVLIEQDGIGKLKLINATGLRCIRLKTGKKKNYKMLIRWIMRERSIKEVSARQVICRGRKQKGLNLMSSPVIYRKES